jgi:hypothetical protein
VNRKAGFAANSGSQNLTLDKPQNFQPSGTLQADANLGDILNPGDSSPITREKSKSWPIIRFFLTFLVIAALMYFFSHR